MHSGDVVLGLQGSKAMRLEIYGKTVTVARKIQKEGYPGKLYLSRATKDLLDANTPERFEFEYNGVIQVGEEEYQTFFTRLVHDELRDQKYFK